MTPVTAKVPVPVPTTAHEAVRQLEERYAALIASGTVQPFLYPWATIGAGLCILYLLFDHRDSWILRQLRFPVWLFNVLASLYTVLYVRGQNPASALGLGIIQGWSILWTANLIVLDDCQADYARIDRVPRPGSGSPVFRTSQFSATNKHDTGPAGSLDTVTAASGNDTTSLQEASNGILRRDSHKIANGHTIGDDPTSPANEINKHCHYFWQHYPDSLYDRLDWAVDTITAFRGGAWNWRISNLSPPPEHVLKSLQTSPPPPFQPSKPSSIPYTTLPTQRAVLNHNIYLIIRNYLILDFTKTLMSHDPYFWGQTNTPLVPSYIPISLATSLVAIRIARLLICCSAMKHSLELIFALGPIFYVAILPARISGLRSEAWMFPDQFGPFSAVLRKGLAGWWGAFWHQTFRKGFETPGNRLVGLLELESRGNVAKLVKLGTAFGLSGFLHACGSYAQVGETDPLRGPIAFFLAQAVGIALEMWAKGQLKRLGILQKIPGWLGAVGNLVSTLTWLYFTAPWMCDDFANGGLWLYEPVPISIFRGPLRLGAKEDGWWRWTGYILRWHRGDTWWQTGLAL